MRVVRLSTLSELAALRPAWNALSAGVPFRTWQWLEAWWRTYGDGPAGVHKNCELFVLAMFDTAGELAGVAPWYLQRSASQGRVIRFLGSGEVCSDYLSILCRAGQEAEVAQSLAGWLASPSVMSDWTGRDDAHAWDLLELNAVTQGDVVVEQLVENLTLFKHVVHRRPGVRCWRINLPETWQQYLAMLSKVQRKHVRRCERAYFDTGRASFHRVENADGLVQGLDILETLHRRRRESLGDCGCFASPPFRTFHREVAARLLELNSLELAWLELDGRPVAAEYQVTGGDVVYAYQSGLEPSALADAPGRLIMIAALRHSISRGLRVYDLLRGDEPYKANWRAQPCPTENILIAPAVGPARFRHSLIVAGDAVKDWLKSGLASRS